MKSFASGSFGPKLFRELALDYRLVHRTDLLSKLGIRSRHNRLLYSVSMLALACVLVLAIWATGHSMQAAEDADSSSTLQIRRIGAPLSKSSAAAGPAAAETQDSAANESASADDLSYTDADSNAYANNKRTEQESQSQGQQQQGGHETQQQQSARAVAGNAAAAAAAAGATAAANGANIVDAVANTTDKLYKQPQQQAGPAAGAGGGAVQSTLANTTAANATAAGH